MQKILACVDFSKESDAVVAFAAGLAQKSGAELILLHVVPPEPDFVGFGVGPQSVRDSVAKRMQDAHVALQEIAAKSAAIGASIKPLTIQGPTVQKIMEQAEKTKADCVVVASHGHGSVYELVVGSVTQGVLRKSKVPVVVVPHG